MLCHRFHAHCIGYSVKLLPFNRYCNVMDRLIYFRMSDETNDTNSEKTFQIILIALAAPITCIFKYTINL